jgi:hypothetical protein
MPVRGPVLALQRHNPAEVIEPQDGRLPAMPGKGDHPIGGSMDVLNDILLQDVIRHSKRLALGIEVFLIQVITIVTVEVADGTSRFGKNLKLTGSFGHCLILHLRVLQNKGFSFTQY